MNDHFTSYTITKLQVNHELVYCLTFPKWIHTLRLNVTIVRFHFVNHFMCCCIPFSLHSVSTLWPTIQWCAIRHWTAFWSCFTFCLHSPRLAPSLIEGLICLFLFLIILLIKLSSYFLSHQIHCSISGIVSMFAFLSIRCIHNKFMARTTITTHSFV